jgi:hypothetical protein
LNVSAGITAVGGAVVNASHRAFAANQDFLTNLLVNAKHVNFAQERITPVRPAPGAADARVNANFAATAAVDTPFNCAWRAMY